MDPLVSQNVNCIASIYVKAIGAFANLAIICKQN